MEKPKIERIIFRKDTGLLGYIRFEKLVENLKLLDHELKHPIRGSQKTDVSTLIKYLQTIDECAHALGFQNAEDCKYVLDNFCKEDNSNEKHN